MTGQHPTRRTRDAGGSGRWTLRSVSGRLFAGARRDRGLAARRLHLGSNSGEDLDAARAEGVAVGQLTGAKDGRSRGDVYPAGLRAGSARATAAPTERPSAPPTRRPSARPGLDAPSFTDFDDKAERGGARVMTRGRIASSVFVLLMAGGAFARLPAGCRRGRRRRRRGAQRAEAELIARPRRAPSSAPPASGSPRARDEGLERRADRRAEAPVGRPRAERPRRGRLAERNVAARRARAARSVRTPPRRLRRGVLVVGDSLQVLTSPYLERYLPGSR